MATHFTHPISATIQWSQHSQCGHFRQCINHHRGPAVQTIEETGSIVHFLPPRPQSNRGGIL